MAGSLGMLLDYFQTPSISKIMPTLERLGAFGLLLLLLSICIQYQWEIADQFSGLMLLAVLFTLVSIFCCYYFLLFFIT